jgi:hypothetical protein
MIRSTTVGYIRANGGHVTYEPERSETSGIINRQHVHVTEGGAASVFGAAQPNPMPKRKRFGGPDYVDPALPL